MTETVSRKEISLNINGNGAVNISSGMSKEEVVEILYSYIRPVLINILAQEIFEEGEGSYEI